MIDIKAIREAADRAAHGLEHTDQINWRVLIGPQEVLALCDEVERLRDKLAQADKDFSDGMTVVHLQVADQMKRRYEPVLKMALETIESIAMDRGLRIGHVEDEIRKVLG